MKFVILLALVAVAYAQGGFRPNHNHNDPLHNLIHEEVNNIVGNNAGIMVDACTSKCDALFDLSAGHDEEMTDRLCSEECHHALHMHAPRPTGHN